MKIRLTRDSVCAGDDVDAPHFDEITVPDDATVEDVVAAIAASTYLAPISGGKATWSVASKIPIAVIAQQWERPRMICSIPYRFEQLDFRDGVLRCYVNYHAQRDPDTVVEVLRRLRLKGIEPAH